MLGRDTPWRADKIQARCSATTAHPRVQDDGGHLGINR
ncbi:hypothetical protein BZL30_9349 [Mycobacterium kansasii]|uniref:Uncharacterized protein n=1 Tax=Mycobacterium kansasii TaxID=1768 RepID=A0A1V3WBY5_MYCKA|nr:hypothetical protein BZL30_9349 [Mycobacterium kansasii]